MSRILESFFRPVYRVRYFADAAARERFEHAVEDFPENFPAAEARAVELGKTLDWVSLISVGMADKDTHLATYGLNVTHETARRRRDRRGEWHCRCGAWLADDAALRRHHDLAGWEPRVNLEG